MKKRFAELSKKERERVEAKYHGMKPELFDDTMSTASPQSPDAIRLPKKLVLKLKVVAKRKGEAEYQNIVKSWIEERLEQENKLAR
jgi:hypothetical protein